MSTVRIAAVASYADRPAIAAFVRQALADFERESGFFAQEDPGKLVVVKPNWIQESHDSKPEVWEPVITHPAVVMAVLEGVAEALGGHGAIALCDAPHTYAGFEAILQRGGLKAELEAFQTRWPGITFECLDLRREVWITKEDVVVARRPNPHDPRGYVRLDLGKDSLFYRHPGEGRFYGADYDTGEVSRHHRGEVHEYLLAGTPVACGLFINIPKLKTHKKTGITCALKNLVGVNGDKNWLPHHTEGCPEDGGDEFPEHAAAHTLERTLKRLGRKAALSIPGLGPWLFRKLRNTGKRVLGGSESTVRNGNWHGNDTCWRMALDLNRALLHGTAEGAWCEAPRAKHYLAIVDGIVGGEGNGPLSPVAVDSGVLLAGTNPAEVDAAACRLMGFDPARVPIVKHAFDEHRWPIAATSLDSVTVADSRAGSDIPLSEVAPAKAGGFEAHFGWTILREDL